ncbi:TlpA family protein disulfide reductase [Hymenobacter ruricola]|uniref:TlpA family protein disulfide reductase n=1 Tax=Hymenobacter ruricola TaxID=2791023 RepID=A0ABS0HZN4_9BACT|nr:TlpA disulfide reductase family protein [Hymenobacter ruricola]MBF9220167.1 TlpA family protein disulfide reductase [Hymenobacter ruricola]
MPSLIQQIIILLLAMASGGAAAQPTAPAILRGRVLHPKDSVVFLARPRSLLDPTPVMATARLNAAGRFTVELDSLRRPLAAQWGLGRPARARRVIPLWLAPGDTLTLEIDAKRPQRSLRFAGRGAAANYYRTAQQRARVENFYDAPEGRPEPKSPARMRARADRYRQRAEAVLAEADRAHPLPPTFRRQEAAAIRYAWGQALLGLHMDYEYRAWGQGPVVRKLPESYYSFLAELPWPQDSLLAHGAYRGFAVGYVRYLLRERRQRLSFSAFVPRQFPWAYDTVRRVLPAGPTRTYLLAQTLDDLLQAGYESDLAPLLAHFQTLGPDQELRAALARRQAQLAFTRAGQPVPNFTLTNLAGQPVRLADFQGQLVYLDLWASWCQPCRAEAPALRALQARFAAQAGQLVFVSLSIDASAAAWRRAVAADHLTDAPNQVQALGQMADPALRRLWEERGVPQYWLLGPDGRILDGNAPRPSDPAAATTLETALRAAAGSLGRKP